MAPRDSQGFDPLAPVKDTSRPGLDREDMFRNVEVNRAGAFGPSSSNRAISELEAHRKTIGEQLLTRVQQQARLAGEIKIVEFILGFMLMFEEGFGLPIPLGQAALVMLAAWALLQPVKRTIRSATWLAPVTVLAFSYLALISYTADPTEYASDWKRRLVRLAITAAVLLFLASGRLDMKSVTWGVVTASLVNIPLFYAGIAPDQYGGYLTGYYIDKNVAGLAYALYGLVVLAFIKNPWIRFFTVVGSAGALWLTGSRTSMFAFAAGCLWILVTPKLGVPGKVVLAAIMYWGMVITSEDFSRVGVFSGREGSDALRARIDAASQIKVEEAGFWGKGLGEAYVWLENNTWFFHNSYWSALVEGGYPWLAAVLFVTIFLAVRFVPGRMLNHESLYAEAAAIAVLICSFRLGEVFFTTSWMLVMALALWGRAVDDEKKRDARKYEESALAV